MGVLKNDRLIHCSTIRWPIVSTWGLCPNNETLETEMKILIGQHITFETEVDNRPDFATVHGDYKIVEMSQEEFEKWADETNSDWISEDYDGEIYFNEYKTKKEIFA